MATIGLDKLYYSKITESTDGDETYATPAKLAEAISADLSVELAEGILYADDGPTDVVREFKNGKITLGTRDISNAVLSDLTGATVDTKGVIVSTAEDGGAPMAIGFRAKKPNGKYRYFWLYRVKFDIPAVKTATKGDNISFSTPTIEGTITRRNKLDAASKHPWKAEITDGETGADATTITNWFTTVYEPVYTTPVTPGQGG